MTTPPVFAQLPLSPALLQGVDALGYTAMTPVQAQALPAILDGRDLVAQAPTGSGKTAAFGLGLLQRLDASRPGHFNLFPSGLSDAIRCEAELCQQRFEWRGSPEGVHPDRRAGHADVTLPTDGRRLLDGDPRRNIGR